MRTFQIRQLPASTLTPFFVGFYWITMIAQAQKMQQFTSPAGGAKLTAGQKTTVTWNNIIIGDSTVSISLCWNAGQEACNQLDGYINNDGSWDWTPNALLPTRNDYFLIMNSGYPVVATSGAFTIQGDSSDSSSGASASVTGGSNGPVSSSSGANPTESTNTALKPSSTRSVIVTVTNANGSVQTNTVGLPTNPNTRPKESTSTPGAIGGTIGGTILLGFLLGFYFFGQRRGWWGKKTATQDQKKKTDVELGNIPGPKSVPANVVEAPAENTITELPATREIAEIMDTTSAKPPAELDGRETIPPTEIFPDLAHEHGREPQQGDRYMPGSIVRSPQTLGASSSAARMGPEYKAADSWMVGDDHLYTDNSLKAVRSEAPGEKLAREIGYDFGVRRQNSCPALKEEIDAASQTRETKDKSANIKKLNKGKQKVV